MGLSCYSIQTYIAKQMFFDIGPASIVCQFIPHYFLKGREDIVYKFPEFLFFNVSSIEFSFKKILDIEFIVFIMETFKNRPNITETRKGKPKSFEICNDLLHFLSSFVIREKLFPLYSALERIVSSHPKEDKDSRVMRADLPKLIQF